MAHNNINKNELKSQVAFLASINLREKNFRKFSRVLLE